MNIPQLHFQNENYHLGHLFMDIMRSRPHVICQIDAATGQSETNASVLFRSIQLARCLRRFGTRPGDVLALGGKNHLDLHIPQYAALLNGMPIAGVDPLFRYNEIKAHFKLCEPKIAFCQKELLQDYFKAIDDLDLNTKVICFDEGEYSLKRFIEKYDDDDDIHQEFMPAVFDLEKVYACLISSGGTTGAMKLIAFKHGICVSKLIELSAIIKTAIKRPTDENTPALHLAPVQWVSGFLNTLAMPYLHVIKIQTSGPDTAEHVIDMINKYKPTSVVMTSILVNSILEEEKECDFSCFDSLIIGGTKLLRDTYFELRKRMRPGTFIIETYGQTENLGPVFMPVPRLPMGCCGNGKYSWHKVKLLDIKTGDEITKTNVPGEMVTKGPRFSEYFKNPDLTAKSFTKDGYYKTGDLMYKDENENYYFVERIQMLINGQPSAPEIEEVLRSHPAVKDVCVTTVRASDVDEWPVACVVRRQGYEVTAQELKDLVAGKLPEAQRLRGGVVFMSQIPTTSTGKIARGKLKQIAFSARRE